MKARLLLKKNDWNIGIKQYIFTKNVYFDLTIHLNTIVSFIKNIFLNLNNFLNIDFRYQTNLKCKKRVIITNDKYKKNKTKLRLKNNQYIIIQFFKLKKSI